MDSGFRNDKSRFQVSGVSGWVRSQNEEHLLSADCSLSADAECKRQLQSRRGGPHSNGYRSGLEESKKEFFKNERPTRECL
jgi:hypothetical protein